METGGPAGALLLAASDAYWGVGTDDRTGRSLPDWLQIPVLRVAQAVGGEPVRVVGTESVTGVDKDTLERVLSIAALAPGASRGPLVTQASADSVTLNGLLTAAIKRVERDANTYAAAVLLEPPKLRFQVGNPDAWLSGTRPYWEYYERWIEEWLRVDQLSSARERWVKLAIELAAAPVDEVPTVFICDEPERGLHRLAEGRLSSGLPVLARTRPFAVMAATHSPALLNSAKIRPLLVSRTNAEGAKVRPAPISLLDRVATETTAYDLGMTVGDLWSLGRVIVVVEGLHDEMVFGSLLRHSLDAAAAGLYAMHGATRLKSLAEPGFIIAATDAHILVVLDELESSVVNPLWDDIQQAAAIGSFDDARTAIDALRQQDGDSFLFLHQFAFRALESGCLHRVHVQGLSLPDVICYLPEAHLLTKPEPWDFLIEQWRADAAPKSARNIKKWLKDRGALPLDDKALDIQVSEAALRAAQENFYVHDDLVQLGARVRMLAGRD